MSMCFLEKPSVENQEKIANHINAMNRLAEYGPFVTDGIIAKLYAPKDTKNIQEGERCFYTRENALIIDTLRKYITESIESDIQKYCLVPLLIKASIHTNTAGVFKGFYKNKANIGCFGGEGENALSRIMKPIRLELPLWSQYEYRTMCCNQNINTCIESLENNSIDVIYLDPPYNQHPYGSNYFMLNVIAQNREPEKISKVSGIPVDWNKSAYNSRISAIRDMKHLLKTGLEKATYLVLSYNDEGIISSDDWKSIFEPYHVEKHEIDYDTYKGSRNLKNRSNKVVEIMYVISTK
jgi:adenine-specific DNA-methyltransferase